MTTSRDVRAAIVDALRLDLVGPWPGHPHEAEVLRDTPSHFYLTGFLVPFEARSANTPDDDEVVDALPKRGGADDDKSPGATSGRRACVPSSMGLSVIVGPSARAIDVEVTWGDYARLDRRPGERKAIDEPNERSRPRWARTMRREHVALDLSGAKRERWSVDLPNSDGVRLDVSRRSLTKDALERLDLPPGAQVLSVFVRNDRDIAPTVTYADERRLSRLACSSRTQCSRNISTRSSWHASRPAGFSVCPSSGRAECGVMA